MDPVTIAAVAGVASAGMQWMNSQEARNASAEERRRIAGIINRVQEPDFNPESITPEEYQVVAKYVPEAAQYIEEVKPTIVQETADMSRGRQAQRSALEKLSEIGSSTGIDPQMMALSNEATRKAQIAANSREQSILQDAQRRGMALSPLMVSQQLAASGDQMDRLAQSQNDIAANAYKERLNALMQSGELGGQMRMQDANIQGQNANIINAFNQRNTANRQAYANQYADMLNNAQKLNIGAAQDAANRNVDTRNKFATAAQDRADQIQRDKFNTGMSKAGVLAGQSAQAVNDMRQNAADKNQAIQGLGNMATIYAQNSAASDADKARQDREDRRTQYMQTGQWTPLEG